MSVTPLSDGFLARSMNEAVVALAIDTLDRDGHGWFVTVVGRTRPTASPEEVVVPFQVVSGRSYGPS
jgi:hypothetical protein